MKCKLTGEKSMEDKNNKKDVDLEEINKTSEEEQNITPLLSYWRIKTN